jgi:hypothetical protein
MPTLKKTKYNKKLVPSPLIVGAFIFVLSVITISLLAYRAPTEVSTLPIQTTTPPQTTDLFAFYRDKLQAQVKSTDPTGALTSLDLISKHLPAVGRICHGLAHEIGQAALAKYGFTTSLTYDAPTCGSGYLHGVVEAKLAKSTDILHDLITTCSVNDGRCLHGIGHGLMYFTLNDIPKSLGFCNHLQNNESRIYCSEGVFMENFGTDVRIHPSVWLKPLEPAYPCAQQSVQYKSSCYFYAPTYYLNVHPNQYLSAIAWCTSSEIAYRQTCATGVGSRAMKYNITQPAVARTICIQIIDGKYRASCIDGMVSYYLVHTNSEKGVENICTLYLGPNRTQCLSSASVRKGWFKD